MAIVAKAYDPDDKEIDTIIPEPGTFEAFYPRETNGNTNSVSRASHTHGSFFQHRNPGEEKEKSVTENLIPFYFISSFDRRQECSCLRLSLRWEKKIQFRLNHSKTQHVQ